MRDHSAVLTYPARSCAWLLLGLTHCAVDRSTGDDQGADTTEVGGSSSTSPAPTASAAPTTSEDPTSFETTGEPSGAATTTSDGTTTSEPTTTSPQWLRSFGDEGMIQTSRGGVAFTSDGSMVLVGKIFGGSYLLDAVEITVPMNTSAVLLMKLSPEGVVQWARTFPNGGLVEVTVTLMNDGDILLGGRWSDTLDLGDGPMDAPMETWMPIYLARFDATGELEWTKTFSATEQSLDSVTVDGDDDILLCGSFQGELDLGGGPLVSPMDEREPFVAKLTGSGERLWDMTYHVESALGTDDGCQLAADGAGNLYLYGSGFVGALDLGPVKLVSAGAHSNPYLVRLDPDGTPVWGKNFPTLGVVSLVARVQEDGTTWLSGDGFAYEAPYGSINFGTKSEGCNDRPCSIAASIDADGQVLQSLTLASSGSMLISDAALDGAGGVILSGLFEGTVTLGAQELTANGGRAGFVTRVDANGAPLWGMPLISTVEVDPGSVAVDGAQRVVVTGDYLDKLTVEPLAVMTPGSTLNMFVLMASQ